MTGKKSTVNTLRQLLQPSSLSSSSLQCPITAPTIVTTKFMPGKTVRYGFAWSWISSSSTSNKINLTFADFINTMTKDEIPESSISSISSSELLNLLILRIQKACNSLSNISSTKNNTTNCILSIPSELSSSSITICGTIVSDNNNLFKFTIIIAIGNDNNDIAIDVIYTINSNNIKNIAIKFYTNLMNDIIRTNRSWRRALR
jgi:hypothetical protein